MNYQPVLATLDQAVHTGWRKLFEEDAKLSLDANTFLDQYNIQGKSHEIVMEFIRATTNTHRYFMQESINDVANNGRKRRMLGLSLMSLLGVSAGFAIAAMSDYLDPNHIGKYYVTIGIGGSIGLGLEYLKAPMYNYLRRRKIRKINKIAKETINLLAISTLQELEEIGKVEAKPTFVM